MFISAPLCTGPEPSPVRVNSTGSWAIGTGRRRGGERSGCRANLVKERQRARLTLEDMADEVAQRGLGLAFDID